MNPGSNIGLAPQLAMKRGGNPQSEGRMIFWGKEAISAGFGGLAWTSMDFHGPKMEVLLIFKREGGWSALGKGGATGGGSGTPTECAVIMEFGVERDHVG